MTGYKLNLSLFRSNKLTVLFLNLYNLYKVIQCDMSTFIYYANSSTNRIQTVVLTFRYLHYLQISSRYNLRILGFDITKIRYFHVAPLLADLPEESPKVVIGIVRLLWTRVRVLSSWTRTFSMPGVEVLGCGCLVLSPGWFTGGSLVF